MSLNILYWNCGSGLLRKLDFIKSIITEQDLDAFFIAEADVRSGFDLGCLSITGYDTVLSRTLESRGKARLVCFKKYELGTINLGSELDDMICLTANGKLIAGIYRGFKCYDLESEKSNFDRLMSSLSEIDLRLEVYVIGDFNIDISKQSSRFLTDITEWCDSKGLAIFDVGVSRSRWVGDTLQESTIDYVLANNKKFNLRKEFTHLSDHYLIGMEIFTYSPIVRKKQWITIRNWQFNYQEANLFLKSLLESSLIMSIDDVNEIDYRIRACLLRTQRKFVKTRKICLKNPCEVTSIKIVKIRNWRNSLRKKWLKDKTALNWVNLIRASRTLKKEVNRVRQKKIKSNMMKGTKEFWHEIKKLQGESTDLIDKLVVNDTEITNKNKIADTFVEFFTNKVNKLLGNYSPDTSSLDISVEDFNHFSLEEIKNSMKRLTNKKSSGLDGLSGFFIKLFVDTIAPYLTIMFNKLITNRSIPDLWKIAKIVPVHKKGPRTEVSNFRPVSNLLTIAKIYELCLLSRIEKLDQDQLHGMSQHGFRKEHSTATAVVEIVDHISNERDQKNLVGMYSVDLTAAFDLLTKEKLVAVLKKKIE